MDLYLIRHPWPAVAPGVCYGAADLPLAEAVAPVAERLKPLLPEGARVLSSPLQRCRQLAEALHPSPVLDPRLQEINFGRWEGKTWDDIYREDRNSLDAWAKDVLHFTPPGGESAAQMQARALACVGELAHEDTVIVTHGGVIRALLVYWLGIPAERWRQVQLDFGHLTKVRVDNQGGRLLCLNR